MKRKPITRAVMERYMNCHLPDIVWELADEENMVGDANDIEEPLDDPQGWLAGKLRKLLKLHNPPPQERAEGFVSRRRQRREALGPVRRMVISELLATLASRREEVTFFRSDALNGQLLAAEQVPEWIASHLGQTMYPRAVVVRLPKGVFPKWNRKNLKLELPVGALDGLPIENVAPTEYLAYAGPGDRFVRHAPIGRDGILADLRSLSVSLARVFTWQEAQATIFVLTGNVPLLPILKTGLSPGAATRLFAGELRQLDCLSRIKLTLDPLTTPSEAEEFYAKIRRRVLLRKPRSLSERHMRLASFCAGRELSRDTMTDWNKQFPDWRYDRLSVFTRSADRAIEHLLHEPRLNSSHFLHDD